MTWQLFSCVQFVVFFVYEIMNDISLQNLTVSAAILCTAVCVCECDVTNKAGMYHLLFCMVKVSNQLSELFCSSLVF